MTLAPPLLVAGLPYSGSAVVAEALHRAGLPLGGPFLPPRPKDAVGGFVDRELDAWHRRWSDGRFAADGERALGELEALLVPRFAGAPAWGLRSPLALDLVELWERRFPAARWLVVVREPSVQVASFASREPLDPARPAGSLLARVRAGLRGWRTGYARVLLHAREHPERVRIVDAGRFAGLDSALDAALRECWGLPIEPPSIERAFRPFLLRRRAPAWIRLTSRLTPGVERTWRELARLALPARPPARRPGPRICVAAHWRWAPSESFVQEQLRRLPGEVHYLYRRGSAWYDRDSRPLAGLGARLVAAAVHELGFAADDIDSRALERYLRRHRFDCMLANFGRVAADASEACRRASVPLVAHFHGADAHRERPAPGAARFYAPLFERAAAIVAVSRPMLERLAELGAPRRKLVLNPCGVDLDDFPPGDPATAPPRFVAAGRFVGKKGPMLTLLAFARVVARRPEARLVMLGEGDLREPCIRLAAALGIEGQVDLPGAFAHGELGARLRGARAFVQHSLRQDDGDSEGLPVAILEAAASALPVVSTRHAGIPHAVVDGSTGLLCDEGDVDGMAERMLRLIDEPALAADMGRRGRRYVAERFALERRVARLAEIVDAAIRRGASPEVDDLAVPPEPLLEEPSALAAGGAQRLAQQLARR